MAITREQLEPGFKVSVKVNKKLVDGRYIGWSAKYDMAEVEVDGRLVPRKVYAILGQGTVEPAVNGVEAEVEDVATAGVEKFDINQRFDFIDKIVTMVAKGPANSLIITGQGGLGKSFTVFNRLELCGLEEDRDFIVVKGYSTPKSLYRSLFENQDRIVIFDDCDSVLDSPVAISILKSALDTTPRRTVAWKTESGSEDLPTSFVFSGKVIFISNRTLHKIDQAILSRSLYVDVSMTGTEKIERIRAIAGSMRPDVHSSISNEVVDFLDEFRDQIGDLNLRTYLKVMTVRVSEPSAWRSIAEYVVTA